MKRLAKALVLGIVWLAVSFGLFAITVLVGYKLIPAVDWLYNVGPGILKSVVIIGWKPAVVYLLIKGLIHSDHEWQESLYSRIRKPSH